MSHRVDGVWPWWLLAAGTTAVLNLDTTVVLLTPLYLQVARRRGDDPMVLAVVPFLLANLASSVLPVSNLTTLIAAERFDIGTAELLRSLGPATVAMLAVGFVAHRRWAASRAAPAVVALRRIGTRPPDGDRPDAGRPRATTVDDRRALLLGGAVVTGLLVAFVLGPAVGHRPLGGGRRRRPGARARPALRCPGASCPSPPPPPSPCSACVVALLVPGDRLGAVVEPPGRDGAVLGSLTAAALAATVDNLPALLALLPGRRPTTR